MKKIIPAILSVLSILQCSACAQKINPVTEKEFVIGTDVCIEDITDFYYTVEDINDAYYQRYRFYKDNGEYFFFHETRKNPGNYGPLTEEYRTAVGTYPLSAEEWETFFSYVKDGTVRKKTYEEGTVTGTRGPWTYLFWEDDRQLEDRVFDFASYAKRADFEKYCAELALKTEETDR